MQFFLESISHDVMMQKVKTERDGHSSIKYALLWNQRRKCVLYICRVSLYLHQVLDCNLCTCPHRNYGMILECKTN